MASAEACEPNTTAYFDKIQAAQQPGNVESVQRTYMELAAHTQEAEEPDAKFLWRLARACFDMQDCKLTDKDWCEEWLRKGIAASERACKADPECGLAHKWAAIMLGTLNPYVGMSEKIENGHRVKEHADKASKLRPEDATVFIILAEFCMAVANVSWLERKAAALIFGSPPESTWDEALEHSLKAAELEIKKPSDRNLDDEAGVGSLQARSAVNVAKCYMKLKNRDQAKLWYEKALLVKPWAVTDQEIQKEAEEVLAKW
eukprot:TRINITY_DN74140_c0_g1_i1.p1 TRINITY_DN74140_c0_g1~~TRINITY_DN74140_c0_g1_i1.p1  ORF type:complete len:278 (-),score=44.18 TRINITY_DN74140_c0_g1_i1:57-836(-)